MFYVSESACCTVRNFARASGALWEYWQDLFIPESCQRNSTTSCQSCERWENSWTLCNLLLRFSLARSTCCSCGCLNGPELVLVIFCCWLWCCFFRRFCCNFSCHRLYRRCFCSLFPTFCWDYCRHLFQRCFWNKQDLVFKTKYY